MNEPGHCTLEFGPEQRAYFFVRARLPKYKKGGEDAYGVCEVLRIEPRYALDGLVCHGIQQLIILDAELRE